MKNKLIKFLNEQPAILRSLVLRINFWIVLFADVALILFSIFLSYLVRFDWSIAGEMARIKHLLLPLVVAKVLIFYVFGLYRGMWRYTSIADLKNIAKAAAVSSGLIVTYLVYRNRFEGYSRSVFFMDGVFTFLLICLHRGAIRYLVQNQELMSWSSRNGQKRLKKRLLLIGAGSAAEKVIREINENVSVPYAVVGMVDDNPNKLGLRIHGISVVGNVDSLKECIDSTKAEEILIAVNSATGEQMKRIVDTCQRSKAAFKVLPNMAEIIKGKLSVSSIRDIAYKDLLGRPSVHLDQEEIGRYLTGQVVLVTGAGGSIGSELCRQIVKFEPKKLILLDAAEENLYRIQMEFQHELQFYNYVPVLCKIQNKALVGSIFDEYRPAVVFHAAAYKHVPLIETNPWEAVFNNVFATKNLIETAVDHGAERFVIVSTDKAVRPTNVMGASKRLTELLMLAYNNDCRRQMAVSDVEKSSSGDRGDSLAAGPRTTFMAVRFGNVLGSSGSVIPLFRRQIEKGGPVTVTDPEMTRYFMSIEEAAQLILQAGAMGRGGEIFLLKMGTPVRIANLAHDLIKLMGLEPETDVKIVYTGLRPGEKLYEELITEGEGIVPTAHEKIMVLHGNGKSIRELESLLDELAAKAKQYDARGIKEVLMKILPEYSPDMGAPSVIRTSRECCRELNN